MNNDLTFFTNEEGRTLLDRFNKILKNNTEYFDVLVGYFRTSGFYKLYESMESVEKIRILVGLNVDKRTKELLNEAEQLSIISSKKAKEIYSNDVINEITESEDLKEVEEGIKAFIKFINSGKLQIKCYPYADIHAKVYIVRKNEKSDYFGSVITGSSNFSQAGFLDNLEFNVELRDSRDVDFALNKFNKLWNDSINVTDEYVETVNKKTWIRDNITPYELFLKFLYEYFKERVNNDKREINDDLIPKEYFKLQYQIDAVNSAKEILEAYNGVFISDVVGLGKTNIACMLAKTLNKGKKLIICPPVLINNWKKVLWEYDVSAKVESLGNLEKILKEDLEDVKYVFIDEAHRFRNNSTDSFAKLHNICIGKKVILISATPQNNYTTDIANQIYLFQPKHNSTIISNEKDIEGFFKTLDKKLKNSKDDKEMYMNTIKKNSQIIRDKVLRHIMIRRTRHEIEQYYGDDLRKQGLSFPQLSSPEKIIYEFDEETDEVFNSTLKCIENLTYSRYKPIIFLKNVPKKYNSLIVGQRNMGGFMKSILLKRLESSFYAIQQTLQRFVDSYDNFIKMYNSGKVYMSKKIDVYDLLDNGDDEKLLSLVDEDKVQMFDTKEFKPEFIELLEYDINILKDTLQKWKNVKSDPKLKYFIKELETNSKFKYNKIIIFTESKETCDYLKLKLNEKFNGQVVGFSGNSSERLRNVIEENFNPNIKKSEQKNDYRILITTDILAEGINLHRANVIVNYDLPWNPTKIMQRVGRINRVGTEFNNIYVFNFFPTSETNKHLSLENNITSKIQAFHKTLGEDFKYLTEQEEVDSFGLLGGKEFGKNYYNKVNSNKIFEDDEDTEVSELKYLSLLRLIRDNDTELYENIKRIPIKSRSSIDSKDCNKVITFFRKGALKKFFISDIDNELELTFDEAIKIMECSREQKSTVINEDYYQMLNKNKNKFIQAISQGEILQEVKGLRKGSNEAKLMVILKALRRCKIFTEIEEMNLKDITKALELGSIPSAIVKKSLNESEKYNNDPIKLFNAIFENIPSEYLKTENPKVQIRDSKTEIILSLYMRGI